MQRSGDKPDIIPNKEGPDTTATLHPLTEASAQDWLGSNQDPDVLLSVPNIGIDRIKVIVDDVRADVELHAKVLDLLELHVGATVSIKKVDIEIDNIRIQAMLKVRLDKVAEIVDRLLQTIEKNPEILTNLTGGIGRGVEKALSPNDSQSQDEIDDGKSGTQLADDEDEKQHA